GPMTTVVMYDEVALARWVEETVRKSTIQVVLGAILRHVETDGRRVTRLDLATRHGDMSVTATGFVDATGDAVVAWQAGLPCREPAGGPIFGSQMVVLEGIEEGDYPARDEMARRQREVGEKYGLVRLDGFAFMFPGRRTALVNMTHIETPLEPLAA